MAEIQETPSPTFAALVTGYFNEDPRYKTWRSHGTQDWLLIYTAGGRGRFSHSQGELIVEAGDIILYRPGVQHDYKTDESAKNWELWWAHFLPRPAWIEWLHWPESGPGLLHLKLSEPVIHQKILERLKEMHRYATGALRHRDVFAMNALEEVLLWCDTQNPRSGQLDSRVREAMDYMCHHLDEAISVDRLGDIAGLSVSRLTHLFRDQAGVSPLQFLEQQRLERACQLLELTGRPIQTIAAEVGFEHPFYFTLRFKRHTGLSPRDYRNRALGGGRDLTEGLMPKGVPK